MSVFSFSFIESVGAFLGLLFVYFEVKESIWVWPAGFLSSVFYIAVFYQSGFYAESLLQIYFAAASVYGFYIWRAKAKVCPVSQVQSVPINQMRSITTLKVLVSSIFLFGLVYALLSAFTSSEVKVWDALVTSLSIIGTWMLAQKYLQHWYVWIAVNSISMFIFFLREMYPSAILYCVFLFASVYGLSIWRNRVALQGGSNVL